MRGIAGVIRFDSQPVRPEEIKSVLRAMAVGPTDRLESWCEGPAGLGHVMQFFFADDPREAQPRISGDGARVVVTDARLDNREELAAALGWNAAVAAQQPDSAFVLAAHEKWGDACAARLSGRFAFVVWLPRERRLFCASDPLGLSPLYYSRRGDEFVFATTLLGMFALGLSRGLDESMLAEVSVGLRLPSSRTLYRDVSRLLGGHVLAVDARGVRTFRHWNPSPNATLRLRSDAEYAEAFGAEIESAVRRAIARMPGEVGLYLSGGLDSSAVAVVAARLLRGQGRRLHAIHLVPSGPNRYASPGRELDESRFVRALQAHAPGIEFHFVPAAAEPSPLESWDDYFADHQVPFRSLPLANNSRLDELLDRLGIGVMLDGRGANLLVSPETIPSGYLEHLLFSGQMVRWWRELHAHRDVYRRPRRWLLRHTTIDAAKRLLFSAGASGPDAAVRWLQPGFRQRTAIDERVRRADAATSAPAFDLRRRWHHLLTEEMAQQSGAPASAISRYPMRRPRLSPLGDWRLNAFCATLPFAQQFRAGWDRRLLREITRGALPDEVRLRTTRGLAQPGFQRALAQFQPQLRAELERLGASAAVRTYLNYDYLRSRWDAAVEQASLGRDLSLVNALALARFLHWHERQPGH